MFKRTSISTETKGSGIEVHFYDGWFDDAPKCPHGPMLLFERYATSQPGLCRYFACSACRDRKKCPAFIFEDDYLKSKKKTILANVETVDNKMTYQNVCSIPPEQRHYCFQCQKFFTEDGVEKHKNHKKMKGVADDLLLCPSTKFLLSLQDDKVHAQYFLSNRSSTFLFDSLQCIHVTHIICLGMPRLHEAAQQSKECKIESILLDIDHRYKMFWPNSKFIHFNMFNHYMFDAIGEESLKAFFLNCSKKKGKLAVVIDPPFGGLVDCICETLKWLKAEYSTVRGEYGGDDIAIMWLFPYFMERRIVDNMEDMHMLDYQVDYDNHKKFKNADCGRKVTPVRIFTNVRNDLIKLPAREEYRYCRKCQRYVHKNNKHCDVCQTCPSKDGRTYVHCAKCGKCMKPGRIHCSKCERCELPTHSCAEKNQVPIGCHVCGEIGHKRRDCPLRSKKRRATDSSVAGRPVVTSGISTT